MDFRMTLQRFFFVICRMRVVSGSDNRQPEDRSNDLTRVVKVLEVRPI